MSEDDIEIVDELHVWAPGWEEKVGVLLRQAARDGAIPVDPDKIYPREEVRLREPQLDCDCAFCRTGIRDGLGHDDGPSRDAADRMGRA